MLLDIVERSVAPSDLLLPRWLLGIAVPTIAAVEGHALGGGLAVALCADMVVMSSESRYGCTFMKMGFTPGMGTTRLLQHVLSPAVAAEMLFTGRTFRGSELQGRCGVNYILPRADVLKKAGALAADVAEKPRGALTLLKQTLAAARQAAYDGALQDEARMHEQSFSQPGMRERIRDYFD
jgi:polyketide biosynthesis enoyl-CoA hydratase PksI